MILFGGSGAGKTTLARALASLGFEWVKPVTTRPPRPGERNDEYKEFLTPLQFAELKMHKQLAYTQTYLTEHGLWDYGFLTADIFWANKDHVMVLDVVTPYSLVYDNTYELWFLDVPESTRYQRLKARGDTPERIQSRLAKDRRELPLWSTLEDGPYNNHILGEWNPEMLGVVVNHVINTHRKPVRK